MDLEADLIELLDTLDRARAVARERLGLSPLECRIVQALCAGPRSISELSRHLVANRPSISMAAQRLEQRGMVERDAGPRATLLTLPSEVCDQYEEITIAPMRHAIGTWRDGHGDVDELVVRRLVQSLVDEFGSDSRVREQDEATDMLHAAFRRGDALRASAIATSLVHEGSTHAAHRALAEAMHRVGEEWASGEATVAQERLASSTAERVVEHLRALVRPSSSAPARGRRAVVLTGTGEEHALPMRIVASELERAGWLVDLLVGEIPLPELVELCTSMAPDAIFVGITMPVNTEPSLPLLRELAAVAPVIVGGQALADPVLAAQAEGAGAQVCACVDRLAALDLPAA